jgi:serine/threonine protein kinase/tetratricopeptide (TPR) repeat protein
MPIQAEEELFDQARAIGDPITRGLFLDSACGADSVLRQNLQRLLALEQQAEQLFTPLAGIDRMDEGEDVALGPRYQVGEKLGEGAFGVVYAAEQQQPVRRTVAVKVLKAGMDTRQVVARFEGERQALAMMDHPHIAKVFDAGITGQGRPYFVMEFVDGVPITRFCEDRNLELRGRIELFILVCQAVQHAHQKGVIHRDLKPSNILVRSEAESSSTPQTVPPTPTPRIIDFGIAKAAGMNEEGTVLTQLHQFIGTPAYISPEQAQISIAAVDTRADIYSLGAVLYEMLAGEPPLDNRKLLTAGLDEMRRIIREEEPRRPSQLRVAAECRSGTSRPAIPTDLDWIVMKCLEKDRDRRYATANGLAADLRRFLQNEPVTARPPSWRYKARKFYIRNRALTLGSVLVALAVFGGLTVATVALVREREARQKADQRLNAALDFVRAVSGEVTPEIASVPGVSKPLSRLAAAQLEFLEKLRATGEDNSELVHFAARLLIELAKSQSSIAVNNSGEPHHALTNALTAVALIESSRPSPVTVEHVQLLEEAEYCVRTALSRLGRHKELIERWPRMEAILQELSRLGVPNVESRRIPARNSHAHALSLSGNYPAAESEFQSLLAEKWVTSITEESSDHEVAVLSNLNAALGVVYELQGQLQRLLEPAQEALKWRGLLVERRKGDVVHKAYELEYRSMAGFALVAAGQTAPGLAQLDRAIDDGAKLVALDQNNPVFLSPTRLAHWRKAKAHLLLARDTFQEPAERGDHLARAEAHLNRAEQLITSPLDHTRLHARLFAETRQALLQAKENATER